MNICQYRKVNENPLEHCGHGGGGHGQGHGQGSGHGRGHGHGVGHQGHGHGGLIVNGSRGPGHLNCRLDLLCFSSSSFWLTNLE